jgi:arylsulfatase A-like enzyme
MYWEYHSYGGRQAVRQGKWKAVKYNCYDPAKTKLMLFNLEDDPSEANDIASQFPEKTKELENIMNQEHSYDPLFPFGESK